MAIKALWKMKMVKIDPVVIGCLAWTKPKRLEENLKEIGSRVTTALVQRTVLLAENGDTTSTCICAVIIVHFNMVI